MPTQSLKPMKESYINYYVFVKDPGRTKPLYCTSVLKLILVQQKCLTTFKVGAKPKHIIYSSSGTTGLFDFCPGILGIISLFLLQNQDICFPKQRAKECDANINVTFLCEISVCPHSSSSSSWSTFRQHG